MELVAWLVLGLGLLNPVNILDGWIGAGLFLYTLAILLIKPKLKKTKTSLIVVLPILVAFFFTGVMNSSHLRDFLSVNPKSGQYMHDMGLYLKTYYLMKEETVNYYQAHGQAFSGHMVMNKLPDNVWGWRLPTVFYLWSIIPVTNGVVIWWLFMMFGLLTLLAVYKISGLMLHESKSKYAILTPYLFFPYLHFAVRDWTMLQVEWWAVFSLIGGIYFYLKKQKSWAVVFFCLAVMIRELILIPLLTLVILSWVFKRKEVKFFLIPVIVFGVFLSGHTVLVSKQVELVKGVSKYALRLHGEGKQLLLTTLAFGSWEYLFYKTRIFLIMMILALVGYLKKISFGKTIVAVNFILALSFLIIGTSEWNHVWGVLYIPMVLLGVVWLFD